ncbi:MAG: valine--tRNA ligase [Candidatus Diapherotrites archaeon]|nr:valine--tRNA ligase [Candidatus Diapherotrites archaeon]
MELPPRPDFQSLETGIRAFWEQEGIYKFNPYSKMPVYSIDTPPPTISGKLHIGHAFSYAQADFIARYKRMRGFNVFYPFGFDNNGLPTERLAEETYKIKAKNMPRKEFVDICLKTSEAIEAQYKEVFFAMGLSCDWSLTYRTIEPKVQKKSQLSFLKLYEKGRVYRKLAPTIWCPRCETAIAQVELKDKEVESVFNYILFELEDGKKIEIATTRPELLPSCCAIFVNPEDMRYKHLIGKKARVPIFDFLVPIMADKRADPNKGTGIVMFCTFGDLTDVEWASAYGFEPKISIDQSGLLNELAGKYKGMRIKDARAAIIEDLKQNGLLVRQIPIKHNVNTHERCDTEIEFLLTNQWFVKYLDLKETYLKAGRKIKWWPKHMFARYENWIKGLQWDWCISRQRYFGVPFPVWYCKQCGLEMLADPDQLPVDPLKDFPKRRCKCGSTEFEPEKDVLDTWATSALTPLINADWPENEKLLKKIYPMSLRPNAHDIITFWDFNTIVMCLFHTGKAPFENIMISGHGLDRHGRKMSKSKGNVVLPLDIIKKYSADALRFWASSVKLGEDLNFKEEDLQIGLRNATKLWNTARFAAMHLKAKPKKPKRLHIIDSWLIQELNEVIDDATNAFEAYEYSKAKTIAENFFWNTFCDYYIEMIKYRLYSGKDKDSALWTLYNALLLQLKLFAPFMPFITEEIYQKLFKASERAKSIHLSGWPETYKVVRSKIAISVGRASVECIAAIRKLKKQKNLSLAHELEEITLYHPDIKNAKKAAEDIKETMRIKNIIFKKGSEILAT